MAKDNDEKLDAAKRFMKKTMKQAGDLAQTGAKQGLDKLSEGVDKASQKLDEIQTKKAEETKPVETPKLPEKKTNQKPSLKDNKSMLALIAMVVIGFAILGIMAITGGDKSDETKSVASESSKVEKSSSSEVSSSSSESSASESDAVQTSGVAVYERADSPYDYYYVINFDKMTISNFISDTPDDIQTYPFTGNLTDGIETKINDVDAAIGAYGKTAIKVVDAQGEMKIAYRQDLSDVEKEFNITLK